MVTRGIVEAVLNEYSYKVRIPIFDRIEADAEHTDYNGLSVAVASIPKGLNNSIKVGDVVFLTFENNNLTEPVIIGQLYREAITNDVTAAFSGRYLEIKEEAKLPANTTIGSVSYDKLFMLANVKYDLQRQIDKLTQDLDYANDQDLEMLRDEISRLYATKASLEKETDKLNKALEKAKQESNTELNKAKDTLSDQFNEAKSEMNDLVSKAQQSAQEAVDKVKEVSDELDQTAKSIAQDLENASKSLEKAKEEIKSVTDALDETAKTTAEEVQSLLDDLEPLAKWKDDVSREESIAGFVAKANADAAVVGDIVTWKNSYGEESFAGTIQKVTANYATTEQVSKVNDNVAIIKTLAEKNEAAIEAVTKADGSIAGLQAQVDKNKASITTLASHVVGDYITLETWDETKADVEIIYYAKDSGLYWYYDEEAVEGEDSWKSTTKAYEAGLTSALAGIQQTADANTANISMITNLEGSFGEAVAGVASKATEDNAEIKALAEYGYTDTDGNKHYGAAGIMSEVDASKSQIEAIAGKDGKIAGLQAEVDKNTAAVNLLASQTIGDYTTIETWDREDKDITKVYYAKDSSDYYYYDDKKSDWVATKNICEAGLSGSIAGIKNTADMNKAELDAVASYEAGNSKGLAGLVFQVDANKSELSTVASYEKDGSKGLAGLVAQVNANKSDLSAVVNHEFTKNDGTKITGLAALNEYVNETESNIALVTDRVAGNYIVLDEVWSETEKDPAIIYYVKAKEKDEKNLWYYHTDAGWKYSEDPYEAGLPRSLSVIQSKTDDNSSAIDTLVNWQGTTGESLVKFTQEAGDKFASASQVAQIVDKDGNVKEAAIVTAVNNNASSIYLSADNITFEGFTSFKAKVEDVEDKSIYDTKVEYALSSQPTEFIAIEGDAGKWSTVAPAWCADAYMWQRTTIVKGDGSTVSSNPTCIQGATGNSLQIKYINSATIPTITGNNVSAWFDTIPTVESGKRTYMTQKMSNETNWSTPVQMSAEDGTTPTIAISNGYWVINGETSSIKAEGDDGNTPVITVGANGNWHIDGVDSGQKAQGEAGKDGSCIEYVYYRSEAEQPNLTPPTYANETLTYGWTQSPQGITAQYKYEYMSMRTKPSGVSTSWSTFSAPVIWSKWGEKGQDGDGVEYKYCLINSSIKPTYPTPEGQTYVWEDEPTGVSESSQYEYVVQIKTTIANGTTTTTTSDVALWAKWGQDGDDAPKVVSEEKQFHVLTSNTTAPDKDSPDWSTVPKNYEKGKYLWTRSVYTMDDKSTIKGDAYLDKNFTTISNWCKDNNEAFIDGANIYAGSITAEQIDVGSLTAHADFKVSIQNSIDDIEIGGRNLAYSDSISHTTTINGGEYPSWNLTKESGYYGTKISEEIFEIGEIYTLSFYLQKTAGVLNNIGGHSGGYTFLSEHIDGNSVSGYGSGVSVTDDTSKHYVVLTFKANKNHTDNNFYIQPNRGGTTSVTYKLWNIKVEKGNKATDWTPAPEDTATKTELEVLQGEINLKADKVDIEGYVTFTNLSEPNSGTIIDGSNISCTNLSTITANLGDVQSISPPPTYGYAKEFIQGADIKVGCSWSDQDWSIGDGRVRWHNNTQIQFSITLPEMVDSTKLVWDKLIVSYVEYKAANLAENVYVNTGGLFKQDIDLLTLSGCTITYSATSVTVTINPNALTVVIPGVNEAASKPESYIVISHSYKIDVYKLIQGAKISLSDEQRILFPKFEVDNSGTLTATDINATGVMNISDGSSLGGFNVVNNSADPVVGLRSLMCGINSDPYLPSDGQKVYSFWAGAKEAQNAAFKVSNYGELYSSSGNIGGWNIYTHGLRGDTIGETILDAGYPSYYSDGTIKENRTESANFSMRYKVDDNHPADKKTARFSMSFKDYNMFEDNYLTLNLKAENPYNSSNDDCYTVANLIGDWRINGAPLNLIASGSFIAIPCYLATATNVNDNTAAWTDAPSNTNMQSNLFSYLDLSSLETYNSTLRSLQNDQKYNSTKVNKGSTGLKTYNQNQGHSVLIDINDINLKGYNRVYVKTYVSTDTYYVYNNSNTPTTAPKASVVNLAQSLVINYTFGKRETSNGDMQPFVILYPKDPNLSSNSLNVLTMQDLKLVVHYEIYGI